MKFINVFTPNDLPILIILTIVSIVYLMVKLYDFYNYCTFMDYTQEQIGDMAVGDTIRMMENSLKSYDSIMKSKRALNQFNPQRVGAGLSNGTVINPGLLIANGTNKAYKMQQAQQNNNSLSQQNMRQHASNQIRQMYKTVSPISPTPTERFEEEFDYYNIMKKVADASFANKVFMFIRKMSLYTAEPTGGETYADIVGATMGKLREDFVTNFLCGLTPEQLNSELGPNKTTILIEMLKNKLYATVIFSIRDRKLEWDYNKRDGAGVRPIDYLVDKDIIDNEKSSEHMRRILIQYMTEDDDSPINFEALFH